MDSTKWLLRLGTPCNLSVDHDPRPTRMLGWASVAVGYCTKWRELGSCFDGFVHLCSRDTWAVDGAHPMQTTGVSSSPRRGLTPVGECEWWLNIVMDSAMSIGEMPKVVDDGHDSANLREPR